MQIDIWTDGSCEPNPGEGGWAAILESGLHSKNISGYIAETTNIRAEIIAAIEALKALIGTGHDVTIHTDSQYVRGAVEGMKKPKANLDLIALMNLEKKKHNVRVEWIRGHTGEDYNELCHQLANEARIAKKGINQ